MNKRRSPLKLPLLPEQSMLREGYEIPLRYLGERGRGHPFVADLSPVPKWILQGPALEALQPAGIEIPERPQQATLKSGILLGRLTARECWLMLLGDERPSFREAGRTQVTDGYAALAVVGDAVWEIFNKICSADLQAPAQGPLCIVQAPVEDVPCLIVKAVGAGMVPGLILCVNRGYGPFILEGVLDAGREFGLWPAGWARFRDWLIR